MQWLPSFLHLLICYSTLGLKETIFLISKTGDLPVTTHTFTVVAWETDSGKSMRLA